MRNREADKTEERKKIYQNKGKRWTGGGLCCLLLSLPKSGVFSLWLIKIFIHKGVCFSDSFLIVSSEIMVNFVWENSTATCHNTLLLRVKFEMSINLLINFIITSLDSKAYRTLFLFATRGVEILYYKTQARDKRIMVNWGFFFVLKRFFPDSIMHINFTV